MPIYEYRCEACRHLHEELQKISDAPLTVCPSCKARALKRLISAPSFRLKGGGWYETDFKSDKERKRNLVESGGDSGKSGSDGAAGESGKSDSKPAEKSASADKSASGEKSAAAGKSAAGEKSASGTKSSGDGQSGSGGKGRKRSGSSEAA